MGPTASGKTQLAVELAQALQGEIISVDSALVYLGMDIGTAKPTLAERQGVPHHLIDIRDPAQSYSAAEFRQDVIRLAAEIDARGHRVILAGGTMLYFKALKDGIASMPPANEAVRQAILEEANKKGWPHIHEQLKTVDPVAAARINPNDPQRLQRALEVYRVSGQCLTSWQQQPTEGAPFPLSELAIVPPDRSEVHRRIEQRFAQMLAMGFEAEVTKLFVREDLNDSLPAIKSVGYRQMWGYLSGEFDFDTMVAKAVAATRQLAKRQFTWLRSWQDLRSLPVPSSSEALKILS
jgi:tRNA dimethylallyltransferase